MLEAVEGFALGVVGLGFRFVGSKVVEVSRLLGLLGPKLNPAPSILNPKQFGVQGVQDLGVYGAAGAPAPRR